MKGTPFNFNLKEELKTQVSRVGLRLGHKLMRHRPR
jgi:hypothetical protein